MNLLPVTEPMAIDFDPTLAIPSNGAGALVISPKKYKKRGRKPGSKNKPKSTGESGGQEKVSKRSKKGKMREQGEHERKQCF